MPKKKKTDKRKPTPEEVKKILEGTNWNEYWRKVNEKVAREIDAYERAAVRSRRIEADHFFLPPAVPSGGPLF